MGLGQPPQGPAAHDNGGGLFRGKGFLVIVGSALVGVAVLAIIVVVLLSGGGGTVPAGPLNQVPDGYVQVVQWDVENLLNGERLDDIQDEFLEAWEGLEDYGIFLDDVTELVSANDDRSNSLLLLRGGFEWDDLRDDLDDVGFDDSEYRNVEVWEESRLGLNIGLLEDRGLVVISSPGDDGVKDVIRAVETGEGFLFEEVDLEITRALGKVKVGFQMMAEEGCGEVYLRSCKGAAYSVGRGVDGF